jgi:hypothetical protein
MISPIHNKDIRVKRLMKLNLWLLAGAPVSSALAQSYDIAWGSQAVPLSPWGNVLIALMLSLAAFVYLRKRSGRGLFVFLVALGVGIGTLNSDTFAFYARGLLIGSQSGQGSVTCTGNDMYVETNVPGGVTLSSVVAHGSVPSTPHSDECTTGSHLVPGDPSGAPYPGCVLSCISSSPP